MENNLQKLLDELRGHGATTYIQTTDLSHFRTITQKILEKHQHYDYFIPRNYGIGDGIIGLDILKQIESPFSITLGYIYSDYRSLETVFKLRAYADGEKSSPHLKVFVYDKNSFNLTRTDILSHSQQGSDFFIIGMNLASFCEAGVRYIYHYNVEIHSSEHCNYSLSDLIQNRAHAFFDISPIKDSAYILDTPNFLINPFGSMRSKTLPASFIFQLIKSIADDHTDSQIVVLTGFSNLWTHRLWKLRIQTLLLLTGRTQHARLQDYTTLKELFTVLKSVQLVISTDTSISHIANYLGIRNISIFNSKRIGKFTRSNLFATSPIAFTMYGTNQFPGLVINSDWTRLTRGVRGLISYLLKQRADTSWSKDLYDSEYVRTHTKDIDAYIIEINQKIDPLHKLGSTNLSL